ncbi:MAG TPA: ZIP family metal transporter [Bacillota bacterium]|nr:ZIP family metal transporter [Bacillota bacterium]HPF42714.1 ZIP family metal transporter [Bacillota bacterium]HPJ85543.1 ZIP family metal transporter [Bacillota bacterium]HPQ62067.1 ZIP family metal transporter [Bacillota bacterium]HRX91736.1 ZIP family metal transporter [Candidatus Izemoplasmatales bacterium]
MFNLPDEITTVIGIAFIFLMTSAGAAMVFFFRKTMSTLAKQLFLGFAAGIMIAASVWSLLIPSIEESEANGVIAWIPAAVGFACGGLFLLLVDNLIPHLHLGEDHPEGLKSSLKRSTMLVFAVTLHNIPEGLAVGLAFGLALYNGSAIAITAAFGLALGIGIQNFPEGAAISLPLRQEKVSAGKSFLYGVLSGAVEPVFALLGIVLATQLTALMPWFLAFAAGAMIYVVVEELIPESTIGEHSNIGTLAVMAGFIIMMILDVALG